MSGISGLTELQLAILKKAWKEKAVGERSITAETLDTKFGADGPDQIKRELENLANRMLIALTKVDGALRMSLTALGISLVREMEEQELSEASRR